MKKLPLLLVLIAVTATATAQLNNVRSNTGSWNVYDNSGNYVATGRAVAIAGNYDWYNIESSTGFWSVYTADGRYVAAGRAEKLGNVYNVLSNGGLWSVYDNTGHYVASGRAEKIPGEFYPDNYGRGHRGRGRQIPAAHTYSWYNVESSTGSWSVYDSSGRYIASGRAYRTSGDNYNVQSSTGMWSIYDSGGRYLMSGRME